MNKIIKEYQFQYTKILDTVLVLLACMAAFIILIFVGVRLSLQEYLIIILDAGLTIFLFKILKKKAVHDCVAKLCETSIEFKFENNSRIIEFNDLISFKAYYGKNGPILYLKNNVDNFKISANNNYCKTDNFQVFCEDTITQLNQYKNTSNINLIHESSIFKTKGMLYFLIIATSIYLFSFFIETPALRVAIGIGGGFYFFIMWTKYFIENKKNK